MRQLRFFQTKLKNHVHTLAGVSWIVLKAGIKACKGVSCGRPYLNKLSCHHAKNNFFRIAGPIVATSILFMMGVNTAFAQTTTGETLATTSANQTSAMSTLTAVKRQYQLTQDRNNINADEFLRLKKEKSDFINQPTTIIVDNSLLNRADLEVALASSNLEGANLSEAEAEQAADTVIARINNLENQLQTVTLAAGKTSAVKAKIALMQSELNTQKDILKWQNKLIQALMTNQDLAKQRYALLQAWRDQLYNMSQIYQKQRNDKKIQAKEENLQRQQQFWLQRLVDLNKQISQLNTTEPDNVSVRASIELQILEAQEQSNLLRLETVLLKLSSESNALFEPLPIDPTVQALKNRLNDGQTISAELANLKYLIEQKRELLQKRVMLEQSVKPQAGSLSYDLNVTAMTDLLVSYKKCLETITHLQNKVAAQQHVVQQALNKALARRQSLPGFNLLAWQALGQQIMTMPDLAVKAGSALKDQVVVAATKLSMSLFAMLVVMQLLWLWVWLRSRRALCQILTECGITYQYVTDKSRYVLLQLCKRHMASFYVIVSLTVVFLFLNLSLITFLPIIYLLLVWLIFKLGLSLAKIVLLENVSSSVGQDTKLFHELYWALIAGGILTMLMVLAHQLPVGYEVADFFNRVFMIFLLVTAIVLLRNWHVAPMLLEPYTKDKPPYLRKAVRLLALLIPLIILSTAVVGLIGYVDLAWNLSKYEGLLLLVMTGYVVVRGFLKDIIEWIAELLISQLQHGWLWRQAFLKPFDKIMRLLLLGGAAATLFWLYGWDQNSLAVKKLVEFLHLHLIDTKGLSLTIENVVSLIIAGMIVSWITKWSREFAFRWLYRKQRDVGVRNSFAALTQYIIFLCSIFLALKIIGVDLSGVSYVIAGFAAGVGLGLRDIIKNYASGLLLLFERPVKTGDVVTIGDFEGEVTHIGMRAMTLKTSDHMQVLVPNSETFEKPFTNWTYDDTIVRTVVALKVVREDNPIHVRNIIFSVLRQLPAVLGDPAPQVFLLDMDDALLEFEVRYFINMQQGRSRTEIRSEVLFLLFEAFKEQGIHTPIPQQNVYLRNVPELI